MPGRRRRDRPPSPSKESAARGSFPLTAAAIQQSVYSLGMAVAGNREKGDSEKKDQIGARSHGTSVWFDHTSLNTPDLVRSRKLSRLGQE